VLIEGEEADMEPGSPLQPEVLPGATSWANATVHKEIPGLKGNSSVLVVSEGKPGWTPVLRLS